ncbi:MAG: hypothetical protein MSS60_02795 [Clostridiales bacterium]|nr:hypothetical protein [Clostridiales bacterium]
MAESFNLLRRVCSLYIAPELSGYSGVVIFAGQDDAGNNIEYRAGDRTGTVLEITNEWGSQAQADAIYRKIRGFKYQTYKAGGTDIDPTAEIGDAVTVADIYSGVFAKKTTFGRHIRTDLKAPSKEEVEHEFQIQSPTNRQYERFTRSVRASLSITATKIAAEVEDRKAADNILRATLNVHAQEIEAKVSKEGGNSSSFGWKLTATGWSVYGNGSEIFGIDRSGAYVNGEIRSKTGKIGNWDINSNSLSYNGQTWGGTNSTGAYIGQSGIQLGKNFRVDMQGNLTAARGTFGSLSVNSSGSTVGTYSGSLSGCGGSVSNLGGSVSGISGSVSGLTGSISTGIKVGSKSIGTYVGDIIADTITASYVRARVGDLNQFVFNGHTVKEKWIKDGNGNSVCVLATQ